MDLHRKCALITKPHKVAPRQTKLVSQIKLLPAKITLLTGIHDWENFGFFSELLSASLPSH